VLLPAYLSARMKKTPRPWHGLVEG